MTAGLQVYNTSGLLQIDETNKNVVLRSMTTVTGGLTTVTLTNAVNPLIAVRSTASPGICVKSMTPGSTYSWVVYGAGTVYIFDVAPTASAHGTGLQVFAADGSVAFDSGYDLFKPVQWESWQPNPINSQQYLGQGTAANGYNIWSQTVGTGAVNQPSGKLWAAVMSSPGHWQKSNYTWGVWSIWNSTGAEFDILQYQTGSGQNVSSGVTGGNELAILFVDVTAFATTAPSSGSITMSPGDQSLSGTSTTSNSFSESVTASNGTVTSYTWSLSNQVGGTFTINSGAGTSAVTVGVTGVTVGTTATATLQCVAAFNGQSTTSTATANLSHQNIAPAATSVAVAPASQTMSGTTTTNTFATETATVTNGTASAYSWTIVSPTNGTFAIANSTSATCTPSVSAVANATTATATLQCVTTVAGTNYTNTASLSYQNTTAGGAFTPVLRTYTSGSSVTETAPTGATNVVIEVWGGGGGGGHGQGRIITCTNVPGYAGGSSGYARSSYAVSGGQTLVYTVGAAGAGAATIGSTGSTGGASTVSSGTKAVTTMTVNGGGGSQDGTTYGAGGTASGGNAVNTTGNNDSAYVSSRVYAPSGVNANTGATPPQGDGGAGGTQSTNPGLAGTGGIIAFYYT